MESLDARERVRCGSVCWAGEIVIVRGRKSYLRTHESRVLCDGDERDVSAVWF